jgi:hypothetical protein
LCPGRGVTRCDGGAGGRQAILDCATLLGPEELDLLVDRAVANRAIGLDVLLAACQVNFSARKASRRGMVAASRYSAARARKPGGGAGSSMRVTYNPAPAMALT